jgi:hypothetical protein
VLPDGHDFSGDEHYEIEEVVALFMIQISAASGNLDGAKVDPVKG